MCARRVGRWHSVAIGLPLDEATTSTRGGRGSGAVVSQCGGDGEHLVRVLVKQGWISSGQWGGRAGGGCR